MGGVGTLSTSAAHKVTIPSHLLGVTRKPVPGDAEIAIVKQHDSHFAPLPNLPTILARFGVCLGIRSCLIRDTNGSTSHPTSPFWS